MNDLGTLLLVKNCPKIVKKCTGEVGDNGDIAKNDNIAMQIFKSDTIRRNEHREMTLHYLHYVHY